MTIYSDKTGKWDTITVEANTTSERRMLRRIFRDLRREYKMKSGRQMISQCLRRLYERQAAERRRQSEE
jgi:(p)ppGpp synthase/HD superfamily hydrolase